MSLLVFCLSVVLYRSAADRNGPIILVKSSTLHPKQLSSQKQTTEPRKPTSGNFKQENLSNDQDSRRHLDQPVSIHPSSKSEKMDRRTLSLAGLSVALFMCILGLTHATPSGPASATCATLEQSRFFGLFSSKTALPSSPCSWTLQNPDPRRYTVYMKITKPTESCIPRQIKTFQFDSFLETSRTYLGMESFDEVVRLCDASSSVAYLESSKQFLQVRKVVPRIGTEILVEEESADDEGKQFNAEFLVVGKRNPSVPACEMLCKWLEDCLTASTHGNPCGIMATPCQCWEQPKRRPGGCYRGGVYVDKCTPTIRDSNRDAEIMSKFVCGW